MEDVATRIRWQSVFHSHIHIVEEYKDPYFSLQTPMTAEECIRAIYYRKVIDDSFVRTAVLYLEDWARDHPEIKQIGSVYTNLVLF
jgi:hypothetical protein